MQFLFKFPQYLRHCTIKKMVPSILFITNANVQRKVVFLVSIQHDLWQFEVQIAAAFTAILLGTNLKFPFLKLFVEIDWFAWWIACLLTSMISDLSIAHIIYFPVVKLDTTKTDGQMIIKISIIVRFDIYPYAH